MNLSSPSRSESTSAATSSAGCSLSVLAAPDASGVMSGLSDERASNASERVTAPRPFSSTRLKRECASSSFSAV